MASLRPVPLTALDVRRAAPANADQPLPLWQRALQHNARIDRRITLSPIDSEQLAIALHTNLQRKSAIVPFAETARAELAGLITGAIVWAPPIDHVRHFEMPVLTADQEAPRFWAALGFRALITRLRAPHQLRHEDAQ